MVELLQDIAKEIKNNYRIKETLRDSYIKNGVKPAEYSITYTQRAVDYECDDGNCSD